MGNTESKNKNNNILKKILIERKKNSKIISNKIQPTNYKITYQILKTMPFCFINDNINKYYEIKNEIFSKCKYGIIRLCNYNEFPNKIFIVKTIKINKFEDNFKKIINEILIFNMLDHPNILNYYEAFFNEKSLELIFEYMEGESLARYFRKMITLNEIEIKPIIYQILLLVNYCHNKGICIRDLKLENFLFIGKNSKTLKLIDLSKSIIIPKFGKSKEFINLGSYTAPEILANDYNEKVDNFSVGCLIYEIFFGICPFNSEEENEIFQNILWKKIDYRANKIKISNNLKYLIKGLLVKDPEDRMSIGEALNNNWFHEILYKIVSIDIWELVNLFQNNFLKFHIKSKLSKIWVKILIKLYYSSLEVEKILNYFYFLDYSNLGYLTIENIKIFMSKEKIFYDESSLNMIMENFNLVSKYYINISEFIITVISNKFLFEDKKLKFLYKKIKLNNNENIKLNDLEEFLKRHGYNFVDIQYQNLFTEYDIKNSGKINFKMFKHSFISSFE